MNRSSSNHTYTNSMPNHIHHHYAPSVTLTYATHIISSTSPTCCHSWTCGQTRPTGVTEMLARWTEKQAAGPRAGRPDVRCQLITCSLALCLSREPLMTFSSCNKYNRNTKQRRSCTMFLWVRKRNLIESRGRWRDGP